MLDFCEERELRRERDRERGYTKIPETIEGHIRDMQFYDIIGIGKYGYTLRKWIFQIELDDRTIKEVYLTRGQFKLLRRGGLGWGSKIKFRVSERGTCQYMQLLSRKRKLKKHKLSNT